MLQEPCQKAYVIENGMTKKIHSIQYGWVDRSETKKVLSAIHFNRAEAEEMLFNLKRIRPLEMELLAVSEATFKLERVFMV